jgi:hypothetical protein
MPASSIESIRTVLVNYRIRISSVLACWRTSIVTVQRTAYAEFIGATAPHQHLVSLVVIAVLYAVNRDLMKRLMISLCASFTMTAGVALAQEFTSTQHVAPQTKPARPPVEQNSNSSWLRKFMAAPNKLQLVNPLAPRQYGSGAQVVVADPEDPQERPYAVRLFSIAF